MMFDVDVFQKSFITYGANKWNNLILGFATLFFAVYYL